jgi:hypothetical protein
MSRGIVCGLGALGLSLFADWKNFHAGDSFVFMLTHLFEKPPLALVMMAFGVGLGFYWGGDAFKPNFRRPRSTPEV